MAVGGGGVSCCGHCCDSPCPTAFGRFLPAFWTCPVMAQSSHFFEPQPPSFEHKQQKHRCRGFCDEASRQSAPEREALPRHPLGRGQGREDAGSQGAGGCSSESRKENWAGRRTGSCHGRDAAGSVFVTGLGGVNSKALTDGGTMSPHFPNSP